MASNEGKWHQELQMGGEEMSGTVYGSLAAVMLALQGHSPLPGQCMPGANVRDEATRH